MNVSWRLVLVMHSRVKTGFKKNFNSVKKFKLERGVDKICPSFAFSVWARDGTATERKIVQKREK